MVSPEADDRELVEACKAGDRRAFQMLYQRYHRRVFAIAQGYVRSPEDALDVVQEAFIKVHRHLPGFEGQSTFYTWLYRIVANLCIDHLRRAGRRQGDVEFDDGMAHDGEPAATALPPAVVGDPARAVKNREIRAAVQQSLEHLSDNHRAVIVMRELQGLSYAEMAQVMNCSKGTIMSRLFHARKNVQRLLRERLDHLPAPDEDGGSLTQEAAS